MQESQSSRCCARSINPTPRRWTCSSFALGLSAYPMVPRPRRYSRPNRASRPSDAISLLHPSLLPGHQPVRPSPDLSPGVLNRARALRRAISKFPTDKKENRYSLSSLPVPRIPLVDTSHVPRHPAPRTRKRTRLASNERACVIAAREEIPIHQHAPSFPRPGKMDKKTETLPSRVSSFSRFGNTEKRGNFSFLLRTFIRW